MPTIHPTAIVDPLANLHPSTTVGPYSIIQGPVTLGPNNTLQHNVTLQGPLTIGEGNTFYPNCTIGLPPQDISFDPTTPGVGTTIGDNNIIREGASIHRATNDHPTTVGNNNYIMGNSHIGHDCKIANNCIVANGVLLAGHVQFNSNVITGGNAGFHQFVRIGRFAMISGLSALAQDVPPFCVHYTDGKIATINRIGLQRNDLGQHLNPLKKAFKLLYRSQLPPKVAAQKIFDQLSDDPLCVEMAQFVLDSKRGIASNRPK